MSVHVDPDRYNHKILDVCLGLHGSVTGASDPMDVAEEAELVRWLESRLQTWTKAPAFSAPFDGTVKLLIEITLSEVWYDQRSRPEGWKNPPSQPALEPKPMADDGGWGDLTADAAPMQPHAIPDAQPYRTRYLKAGWTDKQASLVQNHRWSLGGVHSVPHWPTMTPRLATAIELDQVCIRDQRIAINNCGAFAGDTSDCPVCQGLHCPARVEGVPEPNSVARLVPSATPTPTPLRFTCASYVPPCPTPVSAEGEFCPSCSEIPF